MYVKNGKCRPFPNKTKSMAFIADTHGLLEDWQVKEISNCDFVFLLGDHLLGDIAKVCKYIPNKKIFGVQGNHDTDYFDEFGVKNIHGKVFQLNGIKILGMGGSYKYKNGDFPLLTQEECENILKDKPSVDLLITHDGWYSPNNEVAKRGLMGIGKYIYDKKVPLHIHGHQHISFEKKHFNGTVEIGVGMNQILIL